MIQNRNVVNPWISIHTETLGLACFLRFPYLILIKHFLVVYIYINLISSNLIKNHLKGEDLFVWMLSHWKTNIRT